MYIYNKYLTSIISQSTLHEVLEKIQDAINIFKVEEHVGFMHEHQTYPFMFL